ncbi:MAG TPA: hypothetical protein VFB59_04825 [Candidatus Saccharimonadales bacterium]|nr:hypothetical protein [Candidatus Saccharimonadales bacterium]
MARLQNRALTDSLLERLRRANLPVQLVKEFTDTKPDTINDWLVGEQRPIGIRLLKLMHLLAALGIDSPELEENVTPYGAFLGRLVAFKLVTPEQAQAFLGTGHVQAVYDTAFGHRDPNDAVIKPKQTLEELEKLYSSVLLEAEDALRRKFVREDSPASGQARASTPSAATPPATEGPSRDHFLMEAAQRLGAVLPLARYLVSEKCSPEERAFVREHLGEEGMFELSTLINRLCSERANTMGG